MIYRLLALAIGYGFGLFQTAYIYGRLHHIDIRNYGSGNAGTTNMMRTLGKKAGYITYFGDILKVILAAVVVHFLIGVNEPVDEVVYICYSGLGAVLGHNFPFYLGFKGGKGVAAASGLIIVFFPYCWYMTVAGYVLFFILLFKTRYVSFASLAAMLSFGMQFIVLNIIGVFGLDFLGQLESDIIVAGMVALVFWGHRENIKRLNNGTERKIKEKRKEN